MKALISLLLFGLYLQQGFAQFSQIPTRPVPTWVEPVALPDSSLKVPEAAVESYYLLVDRQDHLTKATRFRHYAIQVLNNEGVQNQSDISQDFDPTYEELHFHFVRVHRNGAVVDKLATHQIQTIQREASMDRHLYDGSLTAVLNLSDVRQGDILEYAYSLVGDNPIYQENYFSGFYQQHSIPVERIYQRILYPSTRKPFVKYLMDAQAGKPIESGGLQGMEWDLRQVPGLLSDQQLPSWYDPYPSVEISTFDSWEEVVQWAAPLYQLPKGVIDDLKEQADHIWADAPDQASAILQTIQFVQEEVRYLGFESGISGYQPSSPLKVLNRRFGDCKDKSLLLVGLLRAQGIVANPMLVHSSTGLQLPENQPSPNAFDHCVVQYEYEGHSLYIDPTMGNQGGSVQDRYFPNYEYGLIVENGRTALQQLPQSNPGKMRVLTTFEVDSIGGSGNMKIRSEYRGRSSDQERRRFAQNNLEEIAQGYLNFYVDYYPGIKQEAPIQVFDSLRLDSNLLIVEESYLIENLWETDETENELYLRLSPIELRNYLSMAATVDRTMPYVIGHYPEIQVDIKAIMPETWPVTPWNESMTTKDFHYKVSTSSRNNVVDIHHAYQSFQTYLPAEEADAFVAKHDSLLANLDYFLTYDLDAVQGSEPGNPWAVILLGVILISCFFLFLWLHRRFDPEARSYANQSIGGWVTAFAVLLFLNLGEIFFALVHDGGLLYLASWEKVVAMEGPQLVTAKTFFITELLYHSFLLAAGVFLLVQFLERRSSFPYLVLMACLLQLGYSLFDALVLDPVSTYESSTLIDGFGGVFVNVIRTLLWGLVFFFSDRVKSTFTIRVAGKKA